MVIELGTIADKFNTKYAPLGALIAHYQQNQVLSPLDKVDIRMKKRDYSPVCKLKQVLISILAGCEYMVEVNSKLKPELALAKVCHLKQFTDQSNLSRVLDALTQMNIEQLERATREVWRSNSQVLVHDWRGFLWLDFDLSGLPCGKQGEKARKGYFAGKKT